ncbi:hypothetical protein B296_00052982, partial [Ensete ventricosum]
LDTSFMDVIAWVHGMHPPVGHPTWWCLRAVSHPPASPAAEKRSGRAGGNRGEDEVVRGKRCGVRSELSLNEKGGRERSDCHGRLG